MSRYRPVVSVTIDPFTLRRLVQHGGARGSGKDDWTRRTGDQFNDRQLYILGCLGEYAASVALGCPMDWEVYEHGDGGTDLKTDAGTVAVKYNHRERGFLMVEERSLDPWHDLTADYILLVHGQCHPPKLCLCAAMINGSTPMAVAVAGWLPREEFKTLARRKDWGLGPRYYVTVDDLHPVAVFPQAVEVAG